MIQRKQKIDGAVLLGKSEEDLHYNVNSPNNELRLKGMKINTKKTKALVLILSRESYKQNQKLNGENLEQVDSYRYLGV